MSKKAGKKGKPSPSRQQQQEAAARRRAAGWAGSAGGSPRRDSAAPAGEGGKPVEEISVQPASGDNATGPAGPGVRYYLDVSAVRIQQWLGRTPDLKFRRGASVMLSEATGRDAWPDSQLPAGTRWNTEAGDLDGVVSLVVEDAVAEADVGACLRSAAREVATTLRRKLPQCPVQAVTGAGDSYASAFAQIERARRAGDLLVDSPPPPAELILAKPCDQCRAAPAEHEKVEIVGRDKGEDLCGECRARVEAAGGTKGDSPRRSPRPERRMQGALAAAGMAVNFPDDFRHLAELARSRKDDAATQLGLICADGNRVGAFLTEAAAYARVHGRPAKSEIVPALDSAVITALADAVSDCFAGYERPPVLAHVAGGDDLMVSVPAQDAWRFLLVLLPAFSRRLAGAAGWPGPVLEKLPSLSAGLVFHHLTDPFPDVASLAQEQLGRAKIAASGRQGSVAFLDLTADGGDAPAGRRPLMLADLDKEAGQLAAVAAVPRSHRETVSALLRLCADTDPACQPATRAEAPAEELARRVVDLGYEALWNVVAGPHAKPAGVRAALVADAGRRAELRRVLDLARWWPATWRQEVAAA
jgi:hypothetical protein